MALLKIQINLLIPDYDPEDEQENDRISDALGDLRDRVLLTAQSNLPPDWKILR